MSTAANTAGEPIIKCVGLQKWYGAVHALKNVDFHAARGEVIGLVGDNGAGKSTLIKILSGVHTQDQGDIFIEGRSVSIIGPEVAMGLGIETIYQYTAMVPEMSIAQNFFIGREPLKFGRPGLGIVDRAKMAREAMEGLRGVGLHLRGPDTPVKALSGGQRQGVAIARAMHFRSKVLILDEPTNHLSVKETNKVLDHVVELKGLGVTSIFISHNLHHIHPISDRIVAMARGEKIADLPAGEISVDEMTRMIS
ncbi:ATP-binding cassette domain-containing protein [Shinella sp.]|uniref:ATP-binding cassette domain-containing protein n=1 Tax=Shinella sp. TaxID=1870904 RepID=UPI0039E4F9DB